MKYNYIHRTKPQSAAAASLLCIAFLFGGLGATKLSAAPGDQINIIPTVTNISLINGQLVALGNVSATKNHKTTTTPFAVPVNLRLADDQTGASGCPILNLELAPIDLNLLGLVVQTSPICLDLTAIPGGGLLGDLLCSVANLLNGGLPLNQILSGVSLPNVPGLTGPQLGSLVGGVTDLLNGVLGNLLNAVATDVTEGAGSICDILHLELGPLDLTLLGLNVVLDDCAGGPVVVDVTGMRGRGNLLGNLLCGLLGSGRAGLGNTLGDILGGLLRQ
jgi:hypothetical protein